MKRYGETAWRQRIRKTIPILHTIKMYSVLIDKKGLCSEYALTACSLAKSLGLKAAINRMSYNHAVYYIQIDGKAYFGQNNDLDLDFPTPDNVYFQ